MSLFSSYQNRKISETKYFVKIVLVTVATRLPSMARTGPKEIFSQHVIDQDILLNNGLNEDPEDHDWWNCYPCSPSKPMFVHSTPNQIQHNANVKKTHWYNFMFLPLFKYLDEYVSHFLSALLFQQSPNSHFLFKRYFYKMSQIYLTIAKYV